MKLGGWVADGVDVRVTVGGSAVGVVVKVGLAVLVAVALGFTVLVADVTMPGRIGGVFVGVSGDIRADVVGVIGKEKRGVSAGIASVGMGINAMASGSVSVAIGAGSAGAISARENT